MNFDITQVPFSCRGSYLALSQNEGEFGGRTAEPGLYLRTVRGAAKDPFLARLTPLCGGRPAAFAPQADPACLHLAADGADIDIAFADAATLLLRGRGAAAGLCLDFLSAGRPYTMLEPLPAAEGVYYASCYVSRTRLVLRAQRGRVCIDQAWNVSSADHARLTVEADGGEFLLAVGEIRGDGAGRGPWDFDAARTRMQRSFEDFCRAMPQVPAPLAAPARLAAYVNWSSLVDASGFLKRETMYMSKNWMCNVYSWDHCFNAIALAQRDPALAWDQFMVLFDHQSAAGRLPDSVNDSEVVDNFCKPPIHGWALHKMRERMTLTRPMQAEAYDKLARWTLWWLNCRDRDGDGLCEYTHGNDSGWDNATAFAPAPPVTLPDLAAFLVVQMDELADLAGGLGRCAAAEFWRQRAQQMLEAMLAKLFDAGGRPFGLQAATGARIDCQSLILCLPIVLADRLPDPARRTLIQMLEGETFRTAHGFATEAPESPLYEADGYWRGPIWAPATMLLLDGLWRCGERDFVRDMARRFAQLVAQSGCAENFDARTGAGLRDRAYTWTASAMLTMAEEYLR